MEKPKVQSLKPTIFQYLNNKTSEKTWKKEEKKYYRQNQ